jgi:aminoglycoside phosphotransferase (APT) family kinase protein
MTSDRTPELVVATPPPAAGERVRWEALPERVRRLIEKRLGATVIEAQSQPGGFSPGLASILTTDDGRTLFVKAAGPELNPDTPGMHRREAEIISMLPEAPTPRFLWSHDEGKDGWMVLAYEAVVGRHWRIPWDAVDLDLVIEALVRLSDALTPSPIGADRVGRTDDEWTIADVNRWERLAGEHPDRLDAWSRRHIDRLVGMQERARDAVRGDTLLHNDLRADNLLITGDRVMVVDWPHARIGAAWIDLAAMAPSVAMQGGPEPEALLMRHPAARAADPEAITTFIALLAGYFLYQAALPDPPGLPTVRAFQRAQGEVTRAWLARRTGWT